MPKDLPHASYYLLLPAIRAAVDILSSHKAEAGRDRNWEKHLTEWTVKGQKSSFVVQVLLSGRPSVRPTSILESVLLVKKENQG